MNWCSSKWCLGISILCHLLGFGVLTYVGFGARNLAPGPEADLIALTVVAAPEESPAPMPAVEVVSAAPSQPVASEMPMEAPAPAAPIQSPALPEPPPVESVAPPIQVASVATPTVEAVVPAGVQPAPSEEPAETPVAAGTPQPLARFDPPPVGASPQPSLIVAVTTGTPQPGVQGEGNSPAPNPMATAPAAQAEVRVGPSYLRNPPPPYPPMARRLHQEGLVVLSVKVTAQGRVAEVAFKEKSGFPLLDQAALQAVREWEFVPARIGSLEVNSEPEVPLRFKLTK